MKFLTWNELFCMNGETVWVEYAKGYLPPQKYTVQIDSLDSSYIKCVCIGYDGMAIFRKKSYDNGEIRFYREEEE